MTEQPALPETSAEPRRGHRRRVRLTNLLALVVMLLGAGLMAYPYVYAVGGSFKTRAEFADDKQSLIPPRYSPQALASAVGGQADADLRRSWREWPPLRNYADAVTYGKIDRFLGNSFIYALLVTIVSLFFNTLAAYAFARMEFPLRDLLFGLLLSTMMIPAAVLLVPRFLVIQHLGLVDTVAGVLLPGFAGAFGIFLLRQFFLNIPADLEHAAAIDGCTRWTTLWRVILPLSKPILITLALFTFMGGGNSFEWPLVVLSNEDFYPLTVGLALFRDQNGQDWPRVLAASVMGSAPLIVLFYAAQRHLVGSITLSGMKA